MAFASLISFLRSARSAVDVRGAFAGAELHIVLGNQACDTDSVVSAMIHAYQLQATTSLRCLPLVACSREDFALKRDTQLLLLQAAAAVSHPFPMDALLFTDDISTFADAAMRVHLVDHNKLDCEALQRALPPSRHDACVVEIVDHHADLAAHADVTGDARCIAFDAATRRGVGSCATLIAARSMPLLDAGIARLLWGVILLDTGNLDAALGKATRRDVDAVVSLEGIIMPGASSEAIHAERSRAYDALYNARADPAWWDTLAPRSVLRADYKAFEAGGVRYGTASMSMHVFRFLRRPPQGSESVIADEPVDADATPSVLRVHDATLAACLEYVSTQGVALLLLLSRCGRQRQLCLILPIDSTLSLPRMRAVEAYMEARLPLVRVPCEVPVSSRAGVAAYLLNDLAITRKQVAPIVDAALAHTAGEV